MKRMVVAAVCSALLIGPLAFADTTGSGSSGAAPPMKHTKHSSQHSQQKAECQSEAKAQNLTGDAAKKFMKSCTAKKSEGSAQKPAPKAPSEPM